VIVEKSLSFFQFFCILAKLRLVFGLKRKLRFYFGAKALSKLHFVDFTAGNETDMIETSNGEEKGNDKSSHTRGAFNEGS
jgi:hypothetical protein